MPGSVAPEPTPGVVPSTAPSPPLEDLRLQLTPVATLDSLTAMTVHPSSGDLYVAERVGRVQRLDPSSSEALGVVIDLSTDVTTDGERGLLGVAIDPAGENLYLSYSGPEGETRLDEVALDGDGSVAGSERRRVLEVEQPFANHNGGDLGFGPDGMLYLALGDGGAAGDPLEAGQDPTLLLGSILRIDPSSEARGAAPYAIPADNPFAGDAEVSGIAAGAPEVWLWGVRNPWRISWDRATDDLWVADVGQGAWEEVNFLPAPDAGRGANLGWNAMEGFEPFGGGTEPDNHVAPVHVYANTGDRCSITGGVVYRGSAIADMTGTYLFGDFCGGRVEGLRLDDDGELSDVADLGLEVGRGRLVGFGEDLDGEVYVLSLDGTVFRIEPAA